MLPGPDLLKALVALPLVPLIGPWHRAVDHVHLLGPPPASPANAPPQPLWPGGAKRSGGRFTPKGAFDTLYLCSDPITGLLEVNAAFNPPGGPLVSMRRNPLTLMQVEGSLGAVLDLTDPVVQVALGTNIQELTGTWRLGINPPTQLLAAAAVQSGRILALRSLSSKAPGSATIIAVFTDLLSSFQPSYLEVVDSTGRLAQRLP